MILIHELEKQNYRLLAKFHVLFVDLNLSKPLQKYEKSAFLQKLTRKFRFVYIRALFYIPVSLAWSKLYYDT